MNANRSEGVSPTTWCKLAFFALLFSQLFVGAYYPTLAELPAMRLAVPLLAGLIALTWARLDAQARHLELPPALRIGIVLLAAVFVPMWLFRSRSVEQAWRALGRFALWLLVMIVAFSIGVAVLERWGIAPKFDSAAAITRPL